MQLVTTCSYIPEEIPQACGLEVNRIWPAKEDTAGSEKFLPRDFCPYAKGVIGWLLNCGEKIHGVSLTNCCDVMRRTADCVEYYNLTENVFLLDLPEKTSGIDVQYYSKQLEHFAQRLSESLNYTWKDDRLVKIIQDIDSREQGMFSQVNINNGNKKYDLKILLGSTCLLDTSLIETLNELGAAVVGLDTCFDERSAIPYNNIPKRENIFLSLAECYLHKPPCPRMWGRNLRLQWLEKILSGRKPHGIIWFVPKFCDHASYELVKLKHEFPDFPLLLVEGEQACGKEGAVLTRIEAFCEQLRMKNKERSTP